MEKNRWKTGIRLAVIIIVAVWFVKTFLVTSCFIPSSGMENSLYQGEGVLVNRWSYGLRLPFSSLFGYHRLGHCRVDKGDIVLFDDPTPQTSQAVLGWHNVFISRCIGLPGDTLMLNHEWIDEGGKVFSPDSKDLYVYPSSQEDLMQSVLRAVGLSDNQLISYTPDGGYIRSFSYYEYYLISQKETNSLSLVPFDDKLSQSIHPYIVPRKGKSVKVYPWNAILLGNTILCHEGKSVVVKGDTLYVEGKAVQDYTFEKNYYWMASNNPVNLSDSRLFGFVPEECIIGKAWRIWFPSRAERFLQRVQ